MIKVWAPKNTCSKRQLQSLLGHLLCVTKCVKSFRTFLNRMLQLLRDNYDSTIIKLSASFKRDLKWFETFLMSYNGVSYFDHVVDREVVHLDACLTGLGGVYKNYVYHLPITKGFQNLTIVHLEMLNIVLAVRVFGAHWHRKKILIKCDNQAVVTVLCSGRTADPFLATCARNLWFDSDLQDIDISYVHVMGKSNVTADLLSRWHTSDENIKKLNSLVCQPLWLNVSQEHLALNCDI